MKSSYYICKEAVNCLGDWEKGLLNVILSNGKEYFDDCYLPYVSRQDYFLWLSEYRKGSVSFYPFTKDMDLFVVGDRLGTITGFLCDVARHVDCIVPSSIHANAIRHRYNAKEDLNVYSQSDNEIPNRKYEIGVVNLEFLHYLDSFLDVEHIKNTFHRIVDNAYSLISSEGVLVVYAMGYDYDLLQRLFYEDGYIYQHLFDPLGNGGLVMEISRRPNLRSKLDGNNLSIMAKSTLLDSKWIRYNDYPFMGGEPTDQDWELIKKVKSIELDLLDKLLDVCNKFQLRIFPIYGTLLGLIRDGGMIDGDDDIDVALPREDYDRLMTLSAEFDGKYFLQTPLTDCCFFGGYAKLRNKETTAIHPQNWWVDCCEGIAIDIFPLDNCYADKKKEISKQKRIRLWQRMLYAKHYGYFASFKDMTILRWKKYVYLAKFFTVEQLVDKLNSTLVEGDDENRLSICVHYDNGSLNHARYMPTKAFTKTIGLMYEGRKMQVPVGWNDILLSQYGEGYMNTVGFNEFKQRHGFYDVDIPYKVYKERFGGLKKPKCITEEIVLFGDVRLFKACLSYYKTRVNVSHLVLLSGDEKECESVYDIDVETWEKFSSRDLPRDSYRAIICSGDARCAEKIMVEHGYSDYYIFWHERNWMLYANQSAIWKEIRNL